MNNVDLRFGVLGPLQLVSNGTPVPLGPAKQRAVLAVLAINRNRPVSVDALTNAVWDDDPVPAARTSIQSHISNLRRLLRTTGVDPNQVLASAPPGYQLNIPDADCDIGRFLTEKEPVPRPPRPGGSRMPATICLLRWRSGAGRYSTICAGTRLSRRSPPRWPKTRSPHTPPAPKPKSLVGGPKR